MERKKSNAKGSPALNESSDSENSGDENKMSNDVLKSILAEDDSEGEAETLSKNSPTKASTVIAPTKEILINETPTKGKAADNDILAEILKEPDEDNKHTSTPQLVKTPKKLDPLEIVEICENSVLSKTVPASHIQELAEGVIDSSINVSRMSYQFFQKIGDKLSEAIGDNKLAGRPNCLRTFGNFVYVGTSLGIIRVFDLEENEHKPIIIRDAQGQKVTCMDISKNGTYLAAGFVNGKIALWDLTKNSLANLVDDIHDRTVLSVRFLKGPKTWIISSDVCGYVFLTEFSKAVFGLSGNSSLLLNNRVAFALTPLYTNSLYNNSSDQLNLVAIGGVNSIIIAALEPSAKVLWELKRKLPIKKGIPYIDWGRGILPNKPDEDSLILAIAWDKVIQLVEVFGECSKESGYTFNGYYESEYEIQAVWWVAESVLLVLNSRNEIKILHSEKMIPGEYSVASRRTKERPSEAPELEQAYKMPEEISMQVYSVGKAKGTEEQQMRNSYQQTFVVKGNQVWGLTKNSIINGKLLAWNEYLDRQRGRSQWIDALSVSLKIYHGTLKGFAELSEDRSLREAGMRAFMKSFIQECLIQHLEKPGSSTDLTANITQMQVTIEFCIGISAHDYLFTELLTLFTEYSLDATFIDSLEPYILSGNFKTVPAPQDLIVKLINHYARNGKVNTLEKVLLSLNLERQDLDFLSNICITHNMYSAIIYIKTMQGHDYHYMEPALYMHNEMQTLRKGQKLSTNDIDMQSLVANDKMNIENTTSRSYTYLGYKILWYIEKCFKGEKFPQRPGDERIPMKSWPNIVYTLLKWMFIERQKVTNLQELMELDVKAVFDVLKLLFENPILRKFLTEPDKYATKDCTGISYVELLGKLATVATSANSPATSSTHHYYLFLAQVSSQPGTTVSSELCAGTSIYLMKTLGKTKDLQKDELEWLVLKMIKNCPDLTPEQIENTIKAAQEMGFTEIEVYLNELKENYFKCFEIYFSLDGGKRTEKVFDWLAHIRETISEDSSNFALIQNLIHELLEKMMYLDTKKTVATVDTWFKQKHRSAVEKLENQPKLQLEYLLTLLQDKEEYIEGILREDSVSLKESEEVKTYKELILLNVKLLCEYRKDEVVKYVKKKYYPLQGCLEICKRYKIKLAVAYLLKRTGEYAEALYIYIMIMKELADKVLSPTTKKDYIELCLEDYKATYESAIKVCLKNALVEHKEKELWFMLLDHLYNIWQNIAQIKQAALASHNRKGSFSSEQASTTINACIKKLLYIMMEHVPFEKIISEVTEKHTELQVENFKEMFNSMIISYLHQAKVLDSAKQVVGNYLLKVMKTAIKNRTKALSVGKSYCAKCGKAVQARKKRNFYAFSCGHIFHSCCVNTLRKCAICSTDSEGITSLDQIMKRVSKYDNEDDEELKREKELEEEKEIEENLAKAHKLVTLAKERVAKRDDYMRKMQIFEKMRVKSFPYTAAEMEEVIDKQKMMQNTEKSQKPIKNMTEKEWVTMRIMQAFKQ